MSSAKSVALALVAGGIIIMGALYFLFPTYSHRYRLTVEIEQDGTVHSGDGIVEVRWNSHGPLEGLFAGPYDVSLIGQGAVVDLGPLGVVITALKPHSFTSKYLPKPLHAKDLAFAAIYGPNFLDNPEYAADSKRLGLRISSYLQQTPGRLALDEQAYPSLVWLPKPNDKSSATPLLAKDFATAIGATTRVKAISIELTNDPFLNPPFKLLPWLEGALAQERQHGVTITPLKFELFATSIME